MPTDTSGRSSNAISPAAFFANPTFGINPATYGRPPSVPWGGGQQNAFRSSPLGGVSPGAGTSGGLRQAPMMPGGGWGSYAGGPPWAPPPPPPGGASSGVLSNGPIDPWAQYRNPGIGGGWGMPRPPMPGWAGYLNWLQSMR